MPISMMTEHGGDLPLSSGAVPSLVHQSSTTIKAQTEKLVGMTSGYVQKREERDKLESFLFHLKSQRLRNPANSLAFYHNGGVDSLLQLSRSLQRDSDEESALLGLVWGTLANLCAFNEEIQHKVHN